MAGVDRKQPYSRKQGQEEKEAGDEERLKKSRLLCAKQVDESKHHGETGGNGSDRNVWEEEAQISANSN